MMDNKTPPKGRGPKKSKTKSTTKMKFGTSSSLGSSMKKPGEPSVNKTVTWRGMESYGYASVIDTIPGDKKGRRRQSSGGILGSGVYRISDEEQSSSKYIEEVKTTFAKRPSIYKEFVRILSEVRNEESDKVEIVKRIIMLFDGYPQLIVGFNYFLPRYIRLEIQEDAVIVKVDDENGDALAQDDSEEEDEDTPTMRYIRNVKWTYKHHPGVYEKFSQVLQDFHKKHRSEVDTIHMIVALFHGHPDLILGFNFFLPAGYKVLADKKHGYVIQNPCKKGLKPHFSPINVQEIYVD